MKRRDFIALGIGTAGVAILAPFITQEPVTQSGIYFADAESGQVTGGTFTLSQGGKTTREIPWNASDEAINNALQNAGISHAKTPAILTRKVDKMTVEF